jgi:hypothetical protein
MELGRFEPPTSWVRSNFGPSHCVILVHDLAWEQQQVGASSPGFTPVRAASVSDSCHRLEPSSGADTLYAIGFLFAMSRLLPERVVHADWSTAPSKRWAAEAVLRDGEYLMSAPVPAANPIAGAIRGERQTLLGFDFPIGLPHAYAQMVDVNAFVELLPELGSGRWSDFFEVAARPEEISLQRPFYPRRPGGTSQRQLLDALGFGSMDELRRVCERKHSGRRAAQVLFWTLGPNQVGRAAIAGWRDMLLPALSQVALWPFQGSVEQLLGSDKVVVCETYPGEFYGHLQLPANKTQPVRMSAAASIRAAAARLGLRLTRELDDEIGRGFVNDDAYDAFGGLLGMINIVTGRRPAAPQLDAQIMSVEGWILGQS